MIGFMPIHRTISLSLLAVSLTIPVSAEIIEGIGVLEQGCYDFSQQMCVHDWDPGADACILYVVDPPLGYMVAAAGYGAIAVVDSAFDDVTAAPTDSSAWVIDYPAFTFVTYIVRTAENHYAKFHILQFIPIVTIEYAYQSDGSRILKDEITGIRDETTTWGRVKALYEN
jgi:hypothetical protein